MCNHTGQADEGEAQQREACKSSEGERETDMLLLVVCVLSVYTGETSLPPTHTHTHCWFVFVQPDQSPASRTIFGCRVYNYYT